jgi:8-oxo-dGTP pyrophosphatase MutT (NUDIX family)
LIDRSHLVRAFDPADAPGDGAWSAIVGDDPTVSALRHAAVLVPIVLRHEGLSVLLTRRTEGLRSHASQISFPGGRMEPTDATPEATALRETEEEIGLPRTRVEVIGRLARRETGTGFGVVPVVGLLTPPFPLAADPTEVAEVFEVPLGFLIDPVNRRFETRIAGGMERRFYAIPYGDYYIWGLTARLLVSLAERLGR